MPYKRFLILIAAIFLLFSCSNSVDDSNNERFPAPKVTLPGVKGGIDNKNDVFAGKMFYTKMKNDVFILSYIFSENSTFVKYGIGENGSVPISEYNYTLSKDNNLIYIAQTKESDDGQLYNYSDYLELYYNGRVKNGNEQDKQFFEEFKNDIYNQFSTIKEYKINYDSLGKNAVCELTDSISSNSIILYSLPY